MEKIIYNAKTKKTEIVDYKFDFEASLTPQEKIEILKQQLSETDYQAIKYAEGQISEEDYVPIKAERQAWRDKINELEEVIQNGS